MFPSRVETILSYKDADPARNRFALSRVAESPLAWSGRFLQANKRAVILVIPGTLVERRFIDGNNTPLDLVTVEVDTASTADRERAFEFLRRHARTGQGENMHSMVVAHISNGSLQ